MLTRRTALVATLAAAVTATTTKAHAATYTDIQPGTPFYAEITWAANKNLISGYPDGTFKPDEPIDRQSFARAAYTYRGKPAYTPPIKSYFSDIPTSHPYYKEISWLVEQGITAGYWDKTFRPANPVERKTIAIFLYRMAGEPHYIPPITSYFTDVPPSMEFYKEISWLKDMKITTGWANGTYQPLEATGRYAICAFFYRYNRVVGY